MMAANMANAKGSTNKVYIGVWGDIGSNQADLEMNGTTGWYYLNGNSKAKRKLVLQSYNKSTGRVVLKAYYKGKFIGTFNGIFREINGSDHYGQIYTGSFKSVKGTTFSFDLYYD